jgi:CCR4-NOT transcription complex subunit 4
LYTSDFPSLSLNSTNQSESTSPLPTPTEPAEPTEPSGHTTSELGVTNATPELDAAQEKAERKAAKKAAAAERAANRAKLAQERAVARAAEKAKEKDRLDREKADKARERAERERMEKEKADKARMEKEAADKARLEMDKERVERERAERERAERERAERERVTQAKKAEVKRSAATSSSAATQLKQSERSATPAASTATALSQVPLLSKMPKKQKPPTKFIRIPKEGEIIHDTTSTVPSATTADAPSLPLIKGSSSVEAISTVPADAAVYSADSSYSERASLEELLDQIDAVQPWMNLLDHPFFDITKINPAAKMPLEYAPLVHALSALSVGGGSFTNNNMPNGSIDNAVSSFQQLLETLTQTISDLLRLLPRTTWDDSSSFDGVLRDMLKGDDFLDDGGEDGQGRDDEVAALTLALERRARWMEVQLSKLEELHRDINTAAVRAVLSFNDRGWDKHSFMPRMGHTLARFDNLSVVQLDDGSTRPMTADELEQKLIVANEAAVFAETELRESMEKMQGLRMAEEDF